MKKLYVIALLSVFAGTISADAPDLKRVTKAIQDEDLVRVKSLWRKIDRNYAVDEKREALDTLIETAGDLAENAKESGSVSGGKNYYKLVPGAFLYAVGLGGTFYSLYWGSDANWRLPKDELPLFYALLIGSGISSVAGQYLVKSGWNSSSSTGGRSKASVIEAYLENALEELDEEDDE